MEVNTYFPDVEAVPIHAIFDLAGPGPNEEDRHSVNAILRDADFIIGRDVMTGNEFFLYGRDLLQEIAIGDEAEHDVSVLVIAIDQGEKSDDLERVCVLMETVMGRCDYEHRRVAIHSAPHPLYPDIMSAAGPVIPERRRFALRLPPPENRRTQ